MILTTVGYELKKGMFPGAVCLLLWLVCLLNSCKGAEVEMELTYGNAELRLVLQVPEQINVTTRADQTLGDYKIKDVRVFQFPPDGSKFADGSDYKMGYYTSVTNGWAEADPTTGGLKINTNSSDFVNENCVFYILVNAGDKLAGVITKAGLQAAVLSLADFSTDIVTTEPAVFTYGPVAYAKASGMTSKPIALLAKLGRMHAKLTVTYTVASGIEITAVCVENIPTELYPFPTVAITPAPSTSASPAVPDYIDKDITLSSGTTTFSIYLPENLRGNGTSTTQDGKNLPTNGPGGMLDLCTCVVLSGTYNYYPGEVGKEPIAVEYRFYPGADMIRSYDIGRGKHYTMKVNVTGANSADARVTITDGNVFTIIEPDEMEYPDMEF